MAEKLNIHKMQNLLEETQIELSDIKADDNFFADEKAIQIKAKKNRANPNRLVFIREDGKLGFPSENSIPINEGDICRGVIMLEQENYFLVQVREIVKT
jgi:hypothetical protein